MIYKAAFAIIGRKMMSMMMMIRDEPITKIANKLLKSTICWPINTNNRRINWHTVQYCMSVSEIKIVCCVGSVEIKIKI